ncbi:hypothetical protein LSCM1_01778 [Leishmania martiniquensis]|uniref:Uncharacterized protein n=1 Tax=Leishmania martiniquensis TaxID=1580590 RepID=A0A836GBW6_9TRYP|nr:hypothetical protein LSCM1_01778 [Leishmania martiniquensis]
MKELDSTIMCGKGVEDGIYVHFFGLDGKAAMLACDMYGILPKNLLYLPKHAFIETGGESEQIVLVRYTMCERSRQGTFRTLLGAKSKLIEEGKVETLWKERCRTLPNASPCPRFTAKQLEETAAALDTDSESDSEWKVDERGMLKPPPPPQPQQVVSPCASVNAEGQANAEAVTRKDSKLCVTTSDAAYGGGQETAPPSPRYTQGFFSADDGATTVTRTEAAGDSLALAADAKPMTQQPHNTNRPYTLVKLLGLPRRRKPPSKPPAIPSAYFPRTRETLTIEEQELAAKEKDLCRFSRRATRHLRARQQERCSGYSTPRRSTSLPPLISSPVPCTDTTRILQSARLRSCRERVAMQRVAEVHLRSLAGRYEQARAIEDEMEAVPTLGTLEHMLEYQKSIGVTPAFEDRIQIRAEREESRAAAQQQTRQAEVDRVCAIEQKEQRAQEVAKRECDEKKDISAEVKRTLQLITHWKRMAAQRQRVAHLGSILGRSASRHDKADRYIEKKRAAANMLRYEHDQQEVHRRQLHDTIRGMLVQKTFLDTDLVSDDMNAVA